MKKKVITYSEKLSKYSFPVFKKWFEANKPEAETRTTEEIYQLVGGKLPKAK
ncbi:MAG: hypothetical protein H8E34_10485 [Bacteroidetes bacterium]|nr:hypothetical protein [Bacteroidota bacterium]